MYSLSWSVDTHSYLCYHSQQIHSDFCKETILCGFISCEDLPPRNTPDSFCRRFTPTKSFACTAWAVFFFLGAAPWKFHEPSERDTGFPANAAAQTGAGTSFGANGDQHTRAAELSTYFCVLTIRKHLLMKRFKRSGRGQEPSRGRKFSILENFLSIRDFTSSMRLHFRCDLVGACLPQTLLIVRAWWREQTACRAYITSPRSYRTDRRYNDRNECSTDS